MTQNIDPLYEKEVECLLCKHKFKTKRVRSRFAVPHKIDSDFCQHYKPGVPNPNYYFVNVCPECGFSFSDQFSSKFSPKVSNIIKEQITKQWKKRDFGGERSLLQAVETYKLAIYSGSIKQENHAVLGGLCLRLAWIYRNEDEKEQEERFMQMALKEYEAAYTMDEYTDASMSEPQILFLIGEVSRRLGLFQKSISYFTKVTEHEKENKDPKMVRMAREQWKIAAEEYRKDQQEKNKEQK